MSRPRSEANRAGQDARPVLPPGSLTQDPPASLGAVGSAVWKTIVEAGRYQDHDARVLERYCQLHDRRAVLLALVDTEGYVVPGSKQQPTGHPAIRLAHDIEAQMIRLSRCLPSTPKRVPAWGWPPLGMTCLPASREPESARVTRFIDEDKRRVIRRLRHHPSITCQSADCRSPEVPIPHAMALEIV